MMALSGPDAMASLSLRFGHSGVSGELSRYTLFVFLFFSFRDITIGNFTSPILGMPTLFFSNPLCSFVLSTFMTHNQLYCIPTPWTQTPYIPFPLSTSLTFPYPTKDPPIDNTY